MKLPEKYDVSIRVNVSGDESIEMQLNLKECERAALMLPGYKNPVIPAVVIELEKSLGFEEE